MSGAKTASWEVDRERRLAAEREASAIRSARHETAGLRRQLAELDHLVARARRRYGDAFEVPAVGPAPHEPTSPTRSEIESHVHRMRNHWKLVKRRFDDSVERAGRALNRAWAEAHSLERRSRALAKRFAALTADGPMADHSRPPQRPPESSLLPAIRAYIEGMKAHCDALETEVTAVQRSTLATALRDRLESRGESADDRSSIRSRPVERGDRSASGELSDGERAIKAQEESWRVLDRLSEGVSAEERSALDRLAEEMVRAEAESLPGRARTLLLDLSLGVQAANEAVAARAERVSEEAHARADRAYAAKVMREELVRLGYEIEEGFGSLFVNKAGRTLVRNPDEPDYGVVVDVAGPEILVEPVRVGGSRGVESRERRHRDREFDEGWCADFDRARESMKGRGVATRILKRERAGSRPLETIGEDKTVRRERDAAVRDRGRTDDARRRRRSRARRQERSH